MSIYDEKVDLPHSFQVQKIVPRDTGILNADGKKIFKNPEPVGYVAPRHHSKYLVKESS